MESLAAHLYMVTLWVLSMTAILDSSLNSVSADVVPPCSLPDSPSNTADVTSGDLIMSTNPPKFIAMQKLSFPSTPLGRFLSEKSKRIRRKADVIPKENLALENKPSLPWSCEENTFWRDLGPGYHPRFVKEVSCKQKSCWYGHFKCKPKQSTVKILHKMAASSSSSPQACPDLDKKWQLKDVTITLYCECGR